jgi:hypothetical protein
MLKEARTSCNKNVLLRLEQKEADKAIAIAKKFSSRYKILQTFNFTQDEDWLFVEHFANYYLSKTVNEENNVRLSPPSLPSVWYSLFRNVDKEYEIRAAKNNATKEFRTVIVKRTKIVEEKAAIKNISFKIEMLANSLSTLFIYQSQNPKTVREKNIEEFIDGEKQRYFS